MSAIHIVLALIAVLGVGATPSLAQTYPAKPVRIIVPTSPGGITDTLARALAQRLTDSFGQTVIVENRPAAPVRSAWILSPSPRPTATR
jgi:tripartite-type tricarboxylate transporter receptor subunit TctC